VAKVTKSDHYST